MAQVNFYITGPGNQQSMAAHNDMQCTLIVQLQGTKRWKLWPVQRKIRAPLFAARTLNATGQSRVTLSLR